MDEFSKYFDNKRFIQWIHNPNDELNTYWETYIREHPSEKKNIIKTRLVIRQLKSKQEKITREEAANLHSCIILKMNRENELSFTSRYLFPLLKYAAVALLLISIGAILYYQYTKNHYLTKYFPVEDIHFNEEARLILSDGEQVTLNTIENTVEYEKNGQIVINKKDTIERIKKSAVAEMNQLIIPYGKNSFVKLPDSTMVFLNAGSSLIYPTIFTGKTREVFLVGEAYFHVAHNPECPFVVKINDLTIKATGTEFNVSAYPTDKIIETVLVEGTVVVMENAFKINKKDVVLTPNSLASFNRESQETIIKQVDIENYTAWRLGYLNFHSEEMSRIISRLERYYNIKIFLDNPLMGKRHITGKLVLKEEKEKVLEVLASAAKADLFKLNDNIYGLR